MSRTFYDIDDAGNVVCTYVDGEKQQEQPQPQQQQTVLQVDKTRVPLAKALFYAFLPAGFPHSVTDDYLSYQLFDSLQAFASSITSLLANRAVLEGLGVGNASSSPTGALILQIVQDTFSRLATILFAHRMGTAIEPECKFYRFLADLLNDAGQLLDLLTPALPAYLPKLSVMVGAAVLRALCGVAANASKASLSAHFARRGNLAELNAKEASQETVVSLLGVLTGTLVVRVVHGRRAVWSLMCLLLACHLLMNYRAVRAVRMATLNRQRATIVFRAWLDDAAVLTPAQVSAREHILRGGRGRMSSRTGDYTGTCDFGSFGDVRAFRPPGWLRYEFETPTYFLGVWLRGGSFMMRIALKETSRTTSTTTTAPASSSTPSPSSSPTFDRPTHPNITALAAWFDAVNHAWHFDDPAALKNGPSSHYENEAPRGYISDERKSVLFASLAQAGWDLETGALETRSPIRVRAGGETKKVPVLLPEKDPAHLC